MNEYIIISDLHRFLAADPANDFKQDFRCAVFLWYQYKKGARIILNGDTEELLQLPPWKTQTDIENENPKSSEAMEKCAWAIIRGNHDKVERICNRPTVPYVTIGELRIMHGHQFDLFNHKPWKWIGDTCAFLGGVAEHVHPDADRWLSNLAYRVRGVGRYGDPKTYEAAAMKYIKQTPRIERLVLGHTHQWVPMGARYGNSGTWTGFRRDYLRLVA